MPRAGNGHSHPKRCLAVLVSVGQDSRCWRGSRGCSRSSSNCTGAENGINVLGWSSQQCCITLWRINRKTHPCSESQHNLGSDSEYPGSGGCMCARVGNVLLPQQLIRAGEGRGAALDPILPLGVLLSAVWPPQETLLKVQPSAPSET